MSALVCRAARHANIAEILVPKLERNNRYDKLPRNALGDKHTPDEMKPSSNSKIMNSYFGYKTLGLRETTKDIRHQTSE